MTLYVKSHNSGVILMELCPFLDLEFLSNLCVQGLSSDSVCCWFETSHTYSRSLDDLVCQVP